MRLCFDSGEMPAPLKPQTTFEIFREAVNFKRRDGLYFACALQFDEVARIRQDLRDMDLRGATTRETAWLERHRQDALLRLDAAIARAKSPRLQPSAYSEDASRLHAAHPNNP